MNGWTNTHKQPQLSLMVLLVSGPGSAVEEIGPAHSTAKGHESHLKSIIESVLRSVCYSPQPQPHSLAAQCESDPDLWLRRLAFCQVCLLEFRAFECSHCSYENKCLQSHEFSAARMRLPRSYWSERHF